MADIGNSSGRQVVALHNALRLSLTALGLEKGEAPKTLTTYIGGKAA